MDFTSRERAMIITALEQFKVNQSDGLKFFATDIHAGKIRDEMRENAKQADKLIQKIHHNP
ncbi:hypothetical protein GWO43_16155 [candidate division KSB1 bacterium]|nr:hypothetical protein [candidate division KSB1 bacterium]NIV68767.1 hypothetical protein [Phycisphaerae bacterium]NIS25484.1 hypothetical protein [candidate division KSB1 bacterium]NIT72377.1 hypothetical protein [candidate division KSB1 bacterium]NIU26161.1 hypothetical protein [candidate division KSB1 bacterium]